MGGVSVTIPGVDGPHHWCLSGTGQVQLLHDAGLGVQVPPEDRSGLVPVLQRLSVNDRDGEARQARYAPSGLVVLKSPFYFLSSLLAMTRRKTPPCLSAPLSSSQGSGRNLQVLNVLPDTVVLQCEGSSINLLDASSVLCQLSLMFLDEIPRTNENVVRGFTEQRVNIQRENKSL